MLISKMIYESRAVTSRETAARHPASRRPRSFLGPLALSSRAAILRSLSLARPRSSSGAFIFSTAWNCLWAGPMSPVKRRSRGGTRSAGPGNRTRRSGADSRERAGCRPPCRGWRPDSERGALDSWDRRPRARVAYCLARQVALLLVQLKIRITVSDRYLCEGAMRVDNLRELK